jgi:hypothetical protein
MAATDDDDVEEVACGGHELFYRESVKAGRAKLTLFVSRETGPSPLFHVKQANPENEPSNSITFQYKN